MRSLVVETGWYSQKYGGFPDHTACALVYHHALTVGAEEIIVQCEKMRPRHYTMDEVREFLEKHPNYATLARSTLPITFLPGVYRQPPGGLLTPK